jgi:hypothetical protein
MNTEPKTIEEFRLALAAIKEANALLQTDNSTLKARVSDLEALDLKSPPDEDDAEEILRRKKCKSVTQPPSQDAKPPQIITRGDFGRGR